MKDAIIEWLKFLKELGIDGIYSEFVLKKQKTEKSKGDKVHVLPSPKDYEGGKEESLKKIKELVLQCRRCRLWEGKRNYVFGEGNPDADIMFVGEAPGVEEDSHGRPFVGEAGQLLTKIIEAMNYKRENVYIGNIIKCRPPNNRTPLKDEIEFCKEFIFKQIAIIKPKVIVALGSTPVITLYGKNIPITKIRGNWFEWRGFPVMPTFHPSYLLRNPANKALRRLVWNDMKECIKKLGRETSEKANFKKS
ncbi:MAG: uracil-DNA glycosylase [Candidatus Aminicenantia bacterium]